MSTVTATVRGTPSLTVAPTQNTAPVLEFRCLFTHDLRKKKRTWHDGSLRFHTFNKRVMVYDDSKNYIGDLHRRHDEDVQEGEELKLDKGVLVEVGEHIGRTETDLAPLLEKRRSEHTSPPAPLPLQQISNAQALRPLVSNTQGRPKSLASVLGASQGPLGRARLPLKSPYEQRRQVETLAPVRNEPPAKKVKLSRERASVVDITVYSATDKQQHAPHLARCGQALRGAPGLLREKLLPLVKEVVVISSDDDGLLHPPTLSSLAARLGRDAAAALNPRTRARQRDQVTAPGPEIAQQCPVTNTLYCSPRQLPETAVASPLVRQVARYVAVGRPGDRSKISNAPITNLLRLRSTKPRQKLICRDVLPSSRQDLCAANGKALDNVMRCRAPRSSWRSGMTVEDRVEDCTKHVSEDQASQSSMSSWLASPSRSKAKHAQQLADAALRRSQSPMFLPNPPAQNVIEESLIPPLVDFVPPSDLASSKSIVVEKQTEENAIWTKETMIETNKPVTGPSRQVKLTEVDQRLLMQPPEIYMPSPSPVVPQAQRSPNSRPLRRVLSENDSRAQVKDDAIPAQPPCAEQQAPSPLASRAVVRGSMAFRSPTILHRSVSDTSALTGTRQAQVATLAPAEEAFEQETGPWTRKEAFLLFNWCPPSYEKPMYSTTGVDSA